MLPLALLCAAVAFTAGFAGLSPHLAVTGARPVAVSGTGFHGHERISVRLRAPGVDRTRHRRATARGRFAATFTQTVVDRCSGFVVFATGADGSRASVRRRALPECPPP